MKLEAITSIDNVKKKQKRDIPSEKVICNYGVYEELNFKW